MSCINVKTTFNRNPLLASISRLSSIIGRIENAVTKRLFITFNIQSKRLFINIQSKGIIIHPTDLTSHIKVSCGIICSINNQPIVPPEHFIYFDKDKLVWDSNGNGSKLIQYNLLTSSGNWIIEELL